jgi:S1-C subfamily serine protease/dienelactone hydrolase
MPRYLTLLAAVALVAPAGAQDNANDATEKALKAAALKAAPFIAKIDTAGGRGVIGGGQPARPGQPPTPGVKKGVGPTSGVVVSKEGHVISSAFNFANKPTAIFVTIPGRERLTYEIVANDTSRMLTLLRIKSEDERAKAKDIPVPPAFPTKDVSVGQWTLALGRALDPEVTNFPSVSVGIVSATGRIYGKCIQTDCKVSPVNYGGPLVAVDGRLMGVLIPASTTGEGETAGVEWYDSGIGFAVPMETVLDSAKRMIASGKDLRRGVLGFIPQNATERYNVPVVVGTVAPESVALKIGLKVGDTITAIDGVAVENYSELQHALGPKYEGDAIDLTVERDGKPVKFDKVVLGGTDVTFAQPFLGILPMRDDNDPGVEVRFVYPKSPAEAAGLKAGDRITKVGAVAAAGGPMPPKGKGPADGLTPITGGRSQMVQFITRFAPGVEIQMEVKRKDGGKVETVKAKLAAIVEDLPARDQLPYPATKEKALEKPKAPMPKGGPAPKKEEPKDDKKDADLPVGFLDKNPTDETKPLTSLTGREYWMYVPDNYDKNRSYGVILWLHATKGQPDAKAMKQTWELFCDQAHFILIGPKSKNQGGWTPNETEDVVNAVNTALKPYTIDRTRVIAHGMGLGGQMALYMAFHARDLIRGAAVSGAVLGINPKDNLPTQPLSFFLIVGDKDPLLKDIQETRDKLTEKRFPIIYREIKNFGKEYLDQKTLDELVVWLDSLDRI